MPIADLVTQTVTTNGLLSISLTGEITFLEREPLRSAINGLSENPPATGIELDLRNVFHIDSSGVALLIDMYRKFCGQVSVIVAESSQPERIMTRTNVTDLLNVRSVFT